RDKDHDRERTSSAMDNLAPLRLFVEVAKAGGFTEAARRLGVSASSISKAVQRLEEELGAKLLVRTTRSVSLTVEGERLLGSARQLIDDADNLTAEFSDSLENPRGRLVISAPAVFGRVWLTERVLAFMRRFPEVEVELMFEDRQVDLVAEGVDIAIRIGQLGDSPNLVARKLFDDRVYSCASPDYLARMGVPEQPDDLTRHRGIHYRVRNTGRLFPFMFEVDGEVVRRTLDPVLVGNSVDALMQAAEQGLGIAQLPSFLAREGFASGRLVEVLAEHRMDRFPYSIIYLDRRLVPPRVRAFVDFAVVDPPRFDDD
ncbi:MAG: LysR family transcriptional regulator, partial [Planctomycetota bacterium]